MDDNILGDVLNYLTDAAHKWREIGIQLKIPSSKLDIIRIDNGDKAERCLVGMLTEFFKTKCCDDKTSWKKIIEALEASSVGEMNIARQIREERKLKVNKRTRGRRNEKEILLEASAEQPRDRTLTPRHRTLTLRHIIPYSRKNCCILTIWIVAILTILLLISFTYLNYKEVFEKIVIQDDMTTKGSDGFTILANDAVIVLNKTDSDSDIINMIIHTPAINHTNIDLYKVSKTLQSLSRPVNKSLKVSTGDGVKLDQRYVLKDTSLDITVNVTTHNVSKQQDCLVKVYAFDIHDKSFASFNLSEFANQPCSRQSKCSCIAGDGKPHSLVSDTSESYNFTVVNTALQAGAIISYRINGTENYYDASDYPVSCSIKGTNKCNLTIAQSQDMILALTKDPDEDYKVDLKYETEVHRIHASNPLTMYICFWALAGTFLICFIILTFVKIKTKLNTRNNEPHHRV